MTWAASPAPKRCCAGSIRCAAWYPLLDRGPQLAASLAAMRAGRSARKEKDSVAVRMDPVDGAV